MHETIIRTGIACKKINWWKSVEFDIQLWNRVQLPINKKEKNFSLVSYQLAQNLVLVFVFYEGKSRR